MPTHEVENQPVDILLISTLKLLEENFYRNIMGIILLTTINYTGALDFGICMQIF